MKAPVCCCLWAFMRISPRRGMSPCAISLCVCCVWLPALFVCVCVWLVCVCDIRRIGISSLESLEITSVFGSVRAGPSDLLPTPSGLCLHPGRPSEVPGRLSDPLNWSTCVVWIEWITSCVEMHKIAIQPSTHLYIIYLYMPVPYRNDNSITTWQPLCTTLYWL